MYGRCLRRSHRDKDDPSEMWSADACRSRVRHFLPLALCADLTMTMHGSDSFTYTEDTQRDRRAEAICFTIPTPIASHE